MELPSPRLAKTTKKREEEGAGRRDVRTFDRRCVVRSDDRAGATKRRAGVREGNNNTKSRSESSSSRANTRDPPCNRRGQPSEHTRRRSSAQDLGEVATSGGEDEEGVTEGVFARGRVGDGDEEVLFDVVGGEAFRDVRQGVGAPHGQFGGAEEAEAPEDSNERPVAFVEGVRREVARERLDDALGDVAAEAVGAFHQETPEGAGAAGVALGGGVVGRGVRRVVGHDDGALEAVQDAALGLAMLEREADDAAAQDGRQERRMHECVGAVVQEARCQVEVLLGDVGPLPEVLEALEEREDC
mmetsp:Transcript_22090/g.67983  ORF Transcript_22090/g.67983 Transcript_22090/m.67983 type:complete len:300 (-) Transcript_22090:1337-2236(-)